MNCNGFDTELRRAVERREAGRQADLRAHAEACPRCAAHWGQHEMLEQAVAAWKSQMPPVDLTDRVMAHWAFEDGGDRCPSRVATVHKSDRRTLGKWAVLGAAVAVLAILLSPLLWRSSKDHPGSVEIAGGSPASQRPQDGLIQDDSSTAARRVSPVRLESAVREAGSAWMGLAKEAGGTVREMAAFLPERTLASVPQRDVEQAPQQPGWTEKLRNEIAPIQRDVGRAMDFLLDTVPLGRSRAI
jgi:hypothetical protein